MHIQTYISVEYGAAPVLHIQTDISVEFEAAPVCTFRQALC